MGITITEESAGRQDMPGVKGIKFVWVSPDGSDLSQATENNYEGKVQGAQIVPGTEGAQPADSFDVKILEVNGGDILLGQGLNCDNTTETNITPLNCGAAPGGKLTIHVMNTGSAGAGTGYLWIEDSV